MRLGLIGTGFWAAEVHAPALAQREDSEFLGLWGRNHEAAAAISNKWDCRVYPTPEALFDDCDLVSFAVPPDVQAQLAVQAAAAGCHLLLEKPVALDLGQAMAVKGAADQAGVASLVFLTFRFKPQLVAWLEGSRRERGWQGGRAVFIGSAAVGPVANSPWRNQWGALWDLGPHLLSMMIPALGPVKESRSIIGVDGFVNVLLLHGGGATSTLLLAKDAPARAARVEVALFGEHGWTIMPDASSPTTDAYVVALGELIDSIARGQPHECDLRFGVEIVRVLEKIAAG